MKTNLITHHISIDEPVVIIPAHEYELLCKEAGITATPKLNKRIEQARNRYQQKKSVSWNKAKHAL